jgi:hypothetical protein
MFEEVGETGFSVFFVPRPYPVPDLESDQGGFVIFKKDDFEAVGQDPFENLLPETSLYMGNKEKIPKESEKNDFSSYHFSFHHI